MCDSQACYAPQSGSGLDNHTISDEFAIKQSNGIHAPEYRFPISRNGGTLQSEYPGNTDLDNKLNKNDMVDKVTNGNMSPVTSNAVFNLQAIKTKDGHLISFSWNERAIYIDSTKVGTF